ncbi:MFS transporter (plasmid) [Rhodococcus erythropolis]|uniref:MFS transporter n=1 Tax=Rhodococcus erythropolis TaxID=1833 RepID=UPI00406BB780
MPLANAHVDDTPEREEWKKGGRTVFFSAIGYGSSAVLFILTASVFVKPTMQATGWSTSEVLISPIATLLLTACGPFAGRMADRWGARRTILTGLIPYIALLALFAFLPISKFTFYGLAVAIGIAGSFAYMVPFNRAVAAWFDKGAGKAFGLVGVGSAVTPLLAVPLVTLAIYNIGWQAGYLVLAGFALVIAMPAVVYGIKERPLQRESVGPESETNSATDTSEHHSVRAVLRTPRYWIFSFSIVAVTAATTAFIANLQPMMLDGGVSLAVATTVTTLFSVGMVIGRLGGGALLDIFPGHKVSVAVTVLLVAALGALSLTAVGSVPVVVTAIGVMLVAASSGAEADFGAYFLLKEYGRRNFGSLYATALAFSGVAGVSFPYLFSSIRDSTGSYFWATIAGAAALAVGALSILIFGLTSPSVTKTSPDSAEPSTPYDGAPVKSH